MLFNENKYIVYTVLVLFFDEMHEISWKNMFLVCVKIMRNGCMNEPTTFYEHLNEDKAPNNCTNKKLFKHVKENKPIIKQIKTEELFRIK